MVDLKLFNTPQAERAVISEINFKMADCKKSPSFEDKTYECYIEELKAWTFVTDLSKEKQRLAVAILFSENDPFHTREKIFSELKIEDLKKETGMATLVVNSWITFSRKMSKQKSMSIMSVKYYYVYEYYGR